jgi:hypothetical protein
MVYITVTELKNNLSHYLELSKTENVYITKNSKVISFLGNPKDQALEDFKNFRGKYGPLIDNKKADELILAEILER